MIKQIDKDGHIKEYCDICRREIDDVCKKCNNYTHPTFTQDITGKIYYHGMGDNNGRDT